MSLQIKCISMKRTGNFKICWIPSSVLNSTIPSEFSTSYKPRGPNLSSVLYHLSLDLAERS
uniref:Uncharacterized protein n=1 Tax=Anguilla anguilla TaxID=7936 RepID=A0A0E9XFQ4_ANGAN